MSLFITISLLLVGFVFLIKGADILIEGSASIAKRYKISNLVIGLTIVAFGTSAPELIISAIAAINGNTGISMGNIIGSNISNTLLILGAAAIVSPLIIKKDTINKQIPFSVLSVLAVVILINDFSIDGMPFSSLTRGDGLVLILFFAIFMYYTYFVSKADKSVLGDLKEEKIEVYSNWTSSSMVVAGLIGLFFGGQWIVASSVNIASIFGLSDALIGLTIVAIGTSLPELAASIMAAKKGNSDMAIGNVIGSNIFNFLWVLGFSSIINPIQYQLQLNVDMFVLLGVTILLLILIYVGKKNILDKQEGFILISLYVCYLAFLIYRG